MARVLVSSPAGLDQGWAQSVLAEHEPGVRVKGLEVTDLDVGTTTRVQLRVDHDSEDLPRRWATITRAHRLRRPPSADGTPGRLGPRAMARCAFALLVDAIRSSTRIAFALESRGLGTGERTQWRTAALTRADGALLVGVVLAVAAVLALAG